MSAHWHFRSALLALPALLALSALTSARPADDANYPSDLPTYRSDVSEVRVTFFATDQNNHALDTLTKADFVVVDNELVVRNFRSFTHSDETALDIVALVDLSESVAPRSRTAMNAVLQLVAREQLIPGDNIAVLSFGGTNEENFGGKFERKFEGTSRGPFGGLRPAILCSSGCGTSGSVGRLLAVKSGGTTPLFDALIFATDFIAHHRRAGARAVIILFSDGNDTISLHSSRDALQAALDADALIYSVDMGTSENASKRASSYASNETPGSAFLRQVSEATGGRYFSFCLRSSQQDGAATVLDAVLDDLRASYVVSYDLPNHRDGFHALRLLPTHNLNLTFHSRNGYFYEPSGH